MLRKSSPYVYELAASIPGLSGVEVQTTRSNLWDRATVLAYKKEASRWGIRTVSMGGSLPDGGTLLDPGPAEAAYLRQELSQTTSQNYQRIPINTIGVLDLTPAGEAFLKQLASANGGTYTRKNGG